MSEVSGESQKGARDSWEPSKRAKGGEGILSRRKWEKMSELEYPTGKLDMIRPIKIPSFPYPRGR